MSKEPAHFVQYVHYDRDLEKGVLGACLIEKNAYGRIQGFLQAECFYDDDHQQVYATIRQMWQDDEVIDILTLVPRLYKATMKTIPGHHIALFCTELTNAVVSTAHLERHSLKIRECYCERQLLRIQQSAASMQGDALDKIDALEKELARLRMISTANDWSDTTDLMFRVSGHMAEVEGKELIGLTTGFSLPDLVTGGFCKTNLIILAARPSVGKSALLNKMAIAQARDGFHVGIVSLEMPKVQIGARMLAMEAEVDFYRIFRNRMRDNEERDRVMDSM